MNVQWDPKIGMATVATVVGSLTVLISVGILWGSTTTKLDTVIQDTRDTKAVQVEQGNKIAAQGNEISAIKSTLSFIVPTIQRIEAAIAPPPQPPALRLPPPRP